jgi:hypothetical protein
VFVGAQDERIFLFDEEAESIDVDNMRVRIDSKCPRSLLKAKYAAARVTVLKKPNEPLQCIKGFGPNSQEAPVITPQQSRK